MREEIRNPKFKRHIFQTSLALFLLLATFSHAHATGITIPAGSSFNLNSGTFNMPGNINNAGTLAVTSGSINVSGSWTNTGTFTPGSSTVTFTGAAPATVSGSTNFFNLSCTVPSKNFVFDSAGNQTISGTLTLTGNSTNKIVLRSSSTGSPWNITDSGTEHVSYVDVQDSTAANSITAYGSTNNDRNVHWAFNSLSITYPAAGKTTGQTPTVIGSAGPGDTVTVKDGGGVTVGTATADVNGGFRVTTSSLAVGAQTLTAYVGGIAGAGVNFFVVAAPTIDQVPTIVSPNASTTIRGNKPTISGKGKAGQSVAVTASDANGNLPLTNIATASVDVNGDYTISSSHYTSALVKGTNYITVTVDGVVSDIQTVSFVDPFGVVFDSVSNNPIQGAVVTIFTSAGVQCVPGAQIAPGDINPQVTAADGAYSFLTINGDFYITVTAAGYTYPSARTSFPAGRTIVAGSKGEVFTVAGAVIQMDHPMDAGTILLKIKKEANKKEVSVGDIVTYTVTIKNENSGDVTNVYLEDRIPAGFKYIKGKAILDGRVLEDPSGDRPVSFNIGTVPAGQTRTLKYQLVVGSGVTFGNYENTARAKYSDNTTISNESRATVKVVPDPLFDMGTVIGKVFCDKNGNGVQDAPKNIGGALVIEGPIPNVQIVTEDGTVITSDKEGKFHLPAIIPGRHLFRLDERSLPKGAYLTTDKVVIVDITQGLLAKVNFGVSFESGTDGGRSALSIVQERNRPVPRLHAGVFKPEDKAEYEFRIFTNYAAFITAWKLQIIDKNSRAVVKTFDGPRATLDVPIHWDGNDRINRPLRQDREYVYLLTVTGTDGGKDVTKEQRLFIKANTSTQIPPPQAITQSAEEEQKARQKWLEEESRVSTLERQNIKIDGEQIKISYQTSQVAHIRILKGGKVDAEVPLVADGGITAADILQSPQKASDAQEGSEIDIILPNGEYDIEGSSGSSGKAHGNQESTAGGVPSSVSSSQHIKVGEDYLFFVGMGDAKMGYTLNRGNIEPVQQDDSYHHGFWAQGKAAYYLRGKIKGKYLITSSFDSERKQKELFKQIDPDKYYPVYGDHSSINYSATNTQGPLYVLVEWDKSSAVWGNYNVGLTDTEFATFNRSLYGGKLHYESLSSTQFGESKTVVTAFNAKAQQKASHNEFIGTGGSLYYLKNKDVIEGSDKVRIEVRDKMSGLVVASKEMVQGSDYEIDYSNGRIVFWLPVSQITASDSIISSRLLDGNPVYVVVDYEYAVTEKIDQGSSGGRIQQSLTDYVRVGGTYVKEEQVDRNYTLEGADAIVHVGRNITLTGEYAESQSEQLGSFVSTDGGLSFTELSTGNEDKGRAYGLKAEAHLFGIVGLNSYYKMITRGFSSAETSSQQGKELMGVAATLDITQHTRLSIAQDIQRLIDEGNLFAQAQVGAHQTSATTVLLTHEMQRLTLTGEYRHQEVSEKKEEFLSETNTKEDTAAIKADYKVNNKVTVSLEQQATLQGSPNHQTSAGVSAQVNEHLSVRAKETVGTQGAATTLGASVRPNNKIELSSDITRANGIAGDMSDTVCVGGRGNVDDKTEIHSTYSVTDSSIGQQAHSMTFGTKREIEKGLDITADKTYALSGPTSTQADTYALSREKDGRRLEGSMSTQRSQCSTGIADTNIFGLSGDINDRWAAMVNYERGKVQNIDGTQTDRNAGATVLSFVFKDPVTQEVLLKGSGKLELRFDQGQENKRQFLVYNAMEGRVNPDLTVFTKANVSQTLNTTAKSIEARYKELMAGFAYRPVNCDRLNLLGRYTYLENNSPDGQVDMSDIVKERSQVLDGEAVYDLTDKWQIAEKMAYKMGQEMVRGFDFTKTQTWLWITRLNYNVNKDWQIGTEYRRLTQIQAEDYRQGFLIEVARKIGDFVQVGVGYNFTNFNDDLTHLNYTAQGPFIRFTGKFYDRTPEEIARARAAKKLRAQERENRQQL